MQIDFFIDGPEVSSLQAHEEWPDWLCYKVDLMIVQGPMMMKDFGASYASYKGHL